MSICALHIRPIDTITVALRLFVALTAPCPRSRHTRPLPSFFAGALPVASLTTSMVPSFGNSSRISQFGTPAPLPEDITQIGSMGALVTENGTTAWAWLWHTDITSGRAL